MITPNTGRSFSVVEVNNFESPRHFRSDLYRYLQSETTVNSPAKKKESLQFIPYMQERDHLGHLISQKVNPISPSLPKSPTHTKYKSFDMSFRNLSPATLPTEGPEFKFEGFKYLPPITTKAKDTLKKILKPSPSNPNSGVSSPCFLSQGRTVTLHKDGPSIGYYDASDSLLHKTVSEVAFPRKIRMVPLVKEEANPNSSAEAVDIMQSFNKVYNKPNLVMEFSKQIDRNNNFVGKNKPNAKPRSKNGEHGFTGTRSIRTKYVSAKDNANELAKFQQTSHNVNPNNLPYTTFGLNDKFSQVKKKYNIFYMKLK